MCLLDRSAAVLKASLGQYKVSVIVVPDMLVLIFFMTSCASEEGPF